ncbi:hypothetical protein ACWDKQ_14340 [Saccharopolyspora sp. NPDC000995]
MALALRHRPADEYARGGAVSQEPGDPRTVLAAQIGAADFKLRLMQYGVAPLASSPNTCSKLAWLPGSIAVTVKAMLPLSMPSS